MRARRLTVSSSASRVLMWSALSEEGSAWLVLTNTSGATPDTLHFTLDPTGLAPGTYSDAVLVIPDDSTVRTVRVPVELRIDRIPPSAGTLTVNTSTLGNQPDPDGYTITVNGAQNRSITNNGTTSYALAAGTYTVQIAGLASNCSVSNGSTSRAATITTGQTTTESFAVDCPAPTPPPQTRLVFSTDPTTTTAGATITPAVRVSAVDGQGNTITTFTGNVRLDIRDNPSGGTLAGNVNASASSGVATFPGLSINRSGTDYTLAAHANGLTDGVSAPFAINPGAPDHLVFTVQPSSTQVNTPIAPAVQVTMLDINGNVATSFTSTVFMNIDHDGALIPPATLSAPGTQRAAAAGVATFEDLRIDKEGVGYTLVASATNLKGGFSAAFDVTTNTPPPPPPATHLEFSQQPPNPIVLSTAFSVTVQALTDQGGVATAYSGPVQLTVQGPVQVGGLTGTTTVNAVGGIARFTNLHVTGLCVGCSILASASGLSGASSTSFNVVLGQ